MEGSAQYLYKLKRRTISLTIAECCDDRIYAEKPLITYGVDIYAKQSEYVGLAYIVHKADCLGVLLTSQRGSERTAIILLGCHGTPDQCKPPIKPTISPIKERNDHQTPLHHSHPPYLRRSQSQRILPRFSRLLEGLGPPL